MLCCVWYTSIVNSFCHPKQFIQAITGANEGKSKMFSVDIHQWTQTEKSWWCFRCNIWFNAVLFHSMFVAVFNNHNPSDIDKFSVSFINTCNFCCNLLSVVKINIPIYDAINIKTIVVRFDKCCVWTIALCLCVKYNVNVFYYIIVLIDNVWLCATWSISITIVKA